MPVAEVAYDSALKSLVCILVGDDQNVAVGGCRDLQSSCVLGEEWVGDVREDNPQHFRGALLEGPGVDIRPIPQNLDRGSYPRSCFGCHSSRAIVDDVADYSCADAGVAGDIVSRRRAGVRGHARGIRHRGTAVVTAGAAQI